MRIRGSDLAIISETKEKAREREEQERGSTRDIRLSRNTGEAKNRPVKSRPLASGRKYRINALSRSSSLERASRKTLDRL